MPAAMGGRASGLMSVAALGADLRQSARICLVGLLLAANQRTRRPVRRPIALVLKYRGVRFHCAVSDLWELQLLRHVFVGGQYRLDPALHPDVIVDAGSNSAVGAVVLPDRLPQRHDRRSRARSCCLPLATGQHARVAGHCPARSRPRRRRGYPGLLPLRRDVDLIAAAQGELGLHGEREADLTSAASRSRPAPSSLS